MAQLNRDMVLWEHRYGSIGVPLEEPESESHEVGAEASRDCEDVVVQSGRFRGIFPKGTFVENVVHIGKNDRVQCLIAGYSVTTVSWAISD